MGSKFMTILTKHCSSPSSKGILNKCRKREPVILNFFGGIIGFHVKTSMVLLSEFPFKIQSHRKHGKYLEVSTAFKIFWQTSRSFSSVKFFSFLLSYTVLTLHAFSSSLSYVVIQKYMLYI